jgi:hypothetical protein
MDEKPILQNASKESKGQFHLRKEELALPSACPFLLNFEEHDNDINTEDEFEGNYFDYSQHHS